MFGMENNDGSGGFSMKPPKIVKLPSEAGFASPAVPPIQETSLEQSRRILDARPDENEYQYGSNTIEGKGFWGLMFVSGIKFFSWFR